MGIFVLGPNVIWMLCVFYVLYQGRIGNDKKILYLLVLNFLFMFSDLYLGKEFLTDDSIEIVITVIEFMQFVLIAYWMKKQDIYQLFTNNDTNASVKKNISFALIGLAICVVLIMLIFIFIL